MRIGRNKDGVLGFYFNKPIKGINEWFPMFEDENHVAVDSNMFSEVKWPDEEQRTCCKTDKGGIVMEEIEFGTCEICGKETELERTYFYYPIHCECCGSKDKNGQKQHFEMVRHCKDCPAPIPKEIHPLLRSMNGNLIRANISNILPSDIQGMFIIRDKVIDISYLEKFKKLPHLAIDYNAKTLPGLPWGVKVVDDWAYAPNLYHFDTEWHVTWIHCSEGDGTLDFHYNTPEECIDKAYDFCVENKLITK